MKSAPAKFKPIDIFRFTTVAAYLKAKTGQTGRSGMQASMAKFLRCHPTHISQIVKGKSRLSAEHAFELSTFLEHNEEEARYFLLMTQKESAGTAKLAAHFDKQIHHIRHQRSDVSHVIEETRPTSPHSWLYYTSWHYAAIHIALTIPQWRTAEALAAKLGIDRHDVTRCLETLVQLGLVRQEAGQFTTTQRTLHLDNTDPAIALHHQAWRLKAIQHVHHDAVTGLHYSGVASFSVSDLERLRAELIHTIRNFVAIGKASPSEKLAAFNLDFFPLQRN